MHAAELTSKILMFTEEEARELLDVMDKAVKAISGDASSFDVMTTRCTLLEYTNDIKEEMRF